MATSALCWNEGPRGPILQSPTWRLAHDLPLGLFDLTTPLFPRFHIHWARARATYRRGGRLLSTGTDEGRPRSWRVEPVQDRQGNGLRLALESGGGRRPELSLSATLYEELPLLVLQLGLRNTLPDPITVDELKALEIDPDWGGALALSSPVDGLYCAGWQSWSPAGWKPLDARDLRTTLGPLFAPMHDASALRPLHPGSFRADLVGVLTPSGEGPAFLAGLLTSARQFGTLQARLRGPRPRLAYHCTADGQLLAPGEQLLSERVALLLGRRSQELLGIYGEALGREMCARVPGSAPRGWCSWPAFGPKVTEDQVLRHVSWLGGQRDSLPVDIVQIDDGWERAVGDWQPNERFPHGMRWLADRISDAGFVPGLWLAPFIVQPTSRLAREHPDWLLRDPRGRPVSAGVSSVGFASGLDVTLPAVESQVRTVVAEMVKDWGYSYLKLDFLYGAALPGRRHRRNLTRAQALRHGLEVIREAAGPETTLVGCGCPLGPAIGLVDTMRVEQDVAPDWKPRLGVATPLLRGDPSFPATVNTLRNMLTRAWMHSRVWMNDPDPLLLRQPGSRLTAAEVRTLETAIAFSGGTWMLGDNLLRLEGDAISMASVTLPPHRGRAVVVDVLQRSMPQLWALPRNEPWGQGWTAALFNWEDRPATLALNLTCLGLEPATPCHMHEFWTGEYRCVQGEAVFTQVEPHGCRTFALRPVGDGPQWVGSTLHLIQGTEVVHWHTGQAGLQFTVDAGRALQGNLLLWWPGSLPSIASVSRDAEARLEQVGGSLWRMHLRAGPRPCLLAIR